LACVVEALNDSIKDLTTALSVANFDSKAGGVGARGSSADLKVALGDLPGENERKGGLHAAFAQAIDLLEHEQKLPSRVGLEEALDALRRARSALHLSMALSAADWVSSELAFAGNRTDTKSKEGLIRLRRLCHDLKGLLRFAAKSNVA